MSDFEMILRAWRQQLPPRFSSSVVDEYIRRHQAEMSKQITQAIARAAKKSNWIGTAPEQSTPVEADPDEQTKSARELANFAAVQIVAAKKPADMTPEDRRAILKYSGWGGLSIERFKGKFPAGMEPDSFGLLHEYYTPTIVCEAIAQRVCPLIPSLAGRDGHIRAVEPSCGIGRMVRALSSPTCPAGDKISWATVELSSVSSKIWRAIRPDVKHYQMSFEQFIREKGEAAKGRAGFLFSNPPYGERGAFALEDPDENYRETKAYVYFLRRGLELLAPGGLGVYMIPAAFLSGPSHRKQRERLLRRFHLSAAFRLPSHYPNAKGEPGKEFIPGAQVVIDVIFWRARGGELAEVDEADKFILEGKYFDENPSHILGRETQPFGESGGKFNPYEIVGTFTGLPPLVERPLCKACSLANVVVDEPVVAEEPTSDLDELSTELQAAIGLGDRVGKYLALRAADDGEKLVQLWPELIGALRDLQQSTYLADYGGNPWRWMDLVALSQRQKIRGAQQLLNAFTKTGNIVDALADEPRFRPRYEGDPNDIVGQATELFKQRRALSLADLMEFHRRVGGKMSEQAALAALLAGDWNLDGEKWDELLPSSAYLTGKTLWERYDLAKRRADEGDEQARKQARRLMDAIKPAVYEDIGDVSPQHGFVPLEMVAEFLSSTINIRYSAIKLFRKDGLVQIEGRRYADDTGTGVAPDTLAFIGWMNHDNELFQPYRETKDDGSGERYTLVEQRVRSAKQWDESFRRWLGGNPKRRAEYTEAYNRAMRGRVVPIYSTEPINIARWGAGSPNLRPHQVAGARRVLDNRGGLIAFDVGVGKTYTAIAIIARARQEGWVRRPVVVVPSSLTWKWHDDIRCTLPDYRVEVIGSNRVRLQRGKRKGQLTSETDTPEQRAAKWVKFQNGEVDVVVLSYDAMDRTLIGDEAVKEHADKIQAIQRAIALRTRDAQKKKKEKLSERQKALLEHGTMAWIKETLALSENEKPDPGIRWDELGIDMLVVDEAQNFKNLYMPAPREGGIPKFMGAAGEGSKRAWQLDFRSAVVRRNTGGAGVVLLSATPAKNSPLEFYNVLQYVDPYAFYGNGIYDPEQFIDRFLKITISDVLDMSFNVTQRSAVTGFQNLDDLRTIILTYGEFRTAEEVGLKLPCPVIEQVTVQMDDEQEEKYERMVSEIEDRLEKGKGGPGMLGMLARLSLIAVHAQLDEGYNFGIALEGGLSKRKVSDLARERYINEGWTIVGKAKEDDDDDDMWIAEKVLPKPSYDSPKFTECARRVVAQKNCGHIIFCEPTATHVWIREVLVKAGVPRERIAILNADVTKPADRVRIAREFNGLSSEPLPAGTCASSKAAEVEPKYDVVIANSVAYEGIDLQVRTCSIHHIDMPWTPSDLQQRNGRGVRQGNTLAVINIYYYFSDGSSDGYRFSLVDGKANWLRELLTSQVRDTNNPAAQQKLSQEDILLMISRDKARTAALFEQRRQAAEAEARKKVAEAASGILRQASGRFRDARGTSDPERAAVLRAEGESRLADLARVDPKAWPWAPWMNAARDTEVIINTAGAPIYEGLKIHRPRAGYPGEYEHLEFGQILHRDDGVRVGLRGAGSGRWQEANPDVIGLTPDMYPREGAPPWPDDEAQTKNAIRILIDDEFGGSRSYGKYENIGWRAASNAFIDKWWPVYARQITDGMGRSNNTRGTMPILVEDRLVLADRWNLDEGVLLAPNNTGWQQYLTLAPATEYKFTELRDVGQFWWNRGIPQNLLSKNRPKKETGEESVENGPAVTAAQYPKEWLPVLRTALERYDVPEDEAESFARRIINVALEVVKTGEYEDDLEGALQFELQFLEDELGSTYAPRDLADEMVRLLSGTLLAKESLPRGENLRRNKQHRLERIEFRANTDTGGLRIIFFRNAPSGPWRYDVKRSLTLVSAGERFDGDVPSMADAIDLLDADGLDQAWYFTFSGWRLDCSAYADTWTYSLSKKGMGVLASGEVSAPIDTDTAEALITGALERLPRGSRPTQARKQADRAPSERDNRVDWYILHELNRTAQTDDRITRYSGEHSITHEEAREAIARLRGSGLIEPNSSGPGWQLTTKGRKKAAGERMPVRSVEVTQVPKNEWRRQIRQHLKSYEDTFGADYMAPDFSEIAGDIYRTTQEAIQRGDDSREALKARFGWLAKELQNTNAPRDFADFVQELISTKIEMKEALPRLEDVARVEKILRDAQVPFVSTCPGKYMGRLTATSDVLYLAPALEAVAELRGDEALIERAQNALDGHDEFRTSESRESEPVPHVRLLVSKSGEKMPRKGWAREAKTKAQQKAELAREARDHAREAKRRLMEPRRSLPNKDKDEDGEASENENLLVTVGEGMPKGADHRLERIEFRANTDTGGLRIIFFRNAPSGPWRYDVKRSLTLVSAGERFDGDVPSMADAIDLLDADGLDQAWYFTFSGWRLDCSAYADTWTYSLSKKGMGVLASGEVSAPIDTDTAEALITGALERLPRGSRPTQARKQADRAPSERDNRVDWYILHELNRTAQTDDRITRYSGEHSITHEEAREAIARLRGSGLIEPNSSGPGWQLTTKGRKKAAGERMPVRSVEVTQVPKNEWRRQIRQHLKSYEDTFGADYMAPDFSEIAGDIYRTTQEAIQRGDDSREALKARFGWLAKELQNTNAPRDFADFVQELISTKIEMKEALPRLEDVARVEKILRDAQVPFVSTCPGKYMGRLTATSDVLYLAPALEAVAELRGDEALIERAQNALDGHDEFRTSESRESEPVPHVRLLVSKSGEKMPRKGWAREAKTKAQQKAELAREARDHAREAKRRLMEPRRPRQSKIVHRFGAPGRPYNDLDTRLAALHPENTHRAIERTTQEMIREYSRMLAEDPDNAAVRLERAEAWLDLGSPGLARMDIQMVLDSQVPGEIRRRAKGLVLRLEQGESLPASVKMPAKARRMWEHVYQSQLERGVEKDRAAASAWSEVKKHYVKQPSGRWVSRTDA